MESRGHKQTMYARRGIESEQGPCIPVITLAESQGEFGGFNNKCIQHEAWV